VIPDETEEGIADLPVRSGRRKDSEMLVSIFFFYQLKENRARKRRGNCVGKVTVYIYIKINKP
jgi:hypothetical protein